MIIRRSFSNLFHNQHIFGQSLDRLDEIIFQRKQSMARIQSSLIDKISKRFFFLGQSINSIGTGGIVIEVLKIHLEEMHLFFHFFKDYLVMPIIAGLFKDSCKKKLIQTTYLIDVHEDYLRFLPCYYLLVQQWHLIIGNNDAQISDVVLLSFEQLLYDHSSGKQVLDYLFNSSSCKDPSDKALDFGGGLFCCKSIFFLHIQLISFVFDQKYHSIALQQVITYNISRLILIKNKGQWHGSFKVCICCGQFNKLIRNKMSSNDNSLLDFLKKKSLFSYSPTTNSKRSRSKSRESQKFVRSSQVDASRSDFQGLNQKIMDLNANDDYYSSQKRQKFVGNFAYQQSPSQIYDSHHNAHNFSNESMSASRRKSVTFQNIDNKDSKIMSGLASYGSSFQSARLESAHCLQNLSAKLQAQIQSINYKIQAFNSRMFRLLNSEFRAIQQRIYKIVQLSFKESEKWIREYMKQKEQFFTGQLIKSKISMERQFLKIEAMNEELQRPNWRKVAGEILSTELQKKVEEALRHSKTLQVQEWSLENYAESHMRIIESQIKSIFRLKS